MLKFKSLSLEGEIFRSVWRRVRHPPFQHLPAARRQIRLDNLWRPQKRHGGCESFPFFGQHFGVTHSFKTTPTHRFWPLLVQTPFQLRGIHYSHLPARKDIDTKIGLKMLTTWGTRSWNPIFFWPNQMKLLPAINHEHIFDLPHNRTAAQYRTATNLIIRTSSTTVETYQPSHSFLGAQHQL